MVDAAVAGWTSVGWSAAVVDLSDAMDKPTILEVLASALAFPAWVGRNWDALDDALRDLSWWPEGRLGRLIVVIGLERATVGSPRDRTMVRDVLRGAAAHWSVSDQPLVVLLTDESEPITRNG
jgi:hypothetical protein